MRPGKGFMRSRRVVRHGLVAAMLLVACVPLLAVPRRTPSRSAPPAAAASPAFLEKYCVTCHNQRARTGGLVLEHLDVSRPADAAATWEKVTRKLRALRR
mgnify:FL=1